MDARIEKLKELGPIGESEGIEPDGLQLKLGALSQLVPFMKLVEREKLRVPGRDFFVPAGGG